MLASVVHLTERPPLFEPGEPRFWDDEYISIGMLDAHMNQEFDAGSRRFEIIDKEIDNLVSRGIITGGDKVLDLGCGPGFYASRLTKKGMHVTGIDISSRSIQAARQQAEAENLDIHYINGSFFDIQYNGGFDVVMQIYGEVNMLSDEDRDLFLARVHDALNPGGLFVFDLSTRVQRQKEGAVNHWHTFDGGLWRPGKHLILEEGFDYPEEDVWLDQYIVVDDDGITVYRDWFHDYSLETILPVLGKAGFSVMQIWNDLAGTPFTGDGDWIALVARKA